MAARVAVEEVGDAEKEGFVEQFALGVEVMGVELEDGLDELRASALLDEILPLN